MSVSAIIKECSRVIPIKEALEVEGEFTQGCGGEEKGVLQARYISSSMTITGSDDMVRIAHKLDSKEKNTSRVSNGYAHEHPCIVYLHLLVKLAFASRMEEAYRSKRGNERMENTLFHRSRLPMVSPHD